MCLHLDTTTSTTHTTTDMVFTHTPSTTHTLLHTTQDITHQCTTQDTTHLTTHTEPTLTLTGVPLSADTSTTEHQLAAKPTKARQIRGQVPL